MAEQNSSSASSPYHNPLLFIEYLEKRMGKEESRYEIDGHGKHIVLFYKKLRDARKIQFLFIKKGLEKGEHCILTTHENEIESIEEEMTIVGDIDVAAAKDKGLLHIYKIPNVLDVDKANGGTDGLKGAENIMSQILLDSKPPYRLVARLIPEIKGEMDAKVHANIERTYHSMFDKFPGSLMCPFPLTNTIIGERRDEIYDHWMQDILQNHHAIIFASSPDEGVCFSNF
jgi:hypothetical protein